MNNLSSSVNSSVEWRRSKVVEMRARGLSYAEIVQQLQVSRASIGSDVQYLRSQAKESIKEYVTEHYLSNTRYVLVHSILYSDMYMKYWKPQTITEKSCNDIS
jgi:orotate phosphoribosyltransferase-like protein